MSESLQPSSIGTNCNLQSPTSNTRSTLKKFTPHRFQFTIQVTNLSNKFDICIDRIRLFAFIGLECSHRAFARYANIVDSKKRRGRLVGLNDRPNFRPFFKSDRRMNVCFNNKTFFSMELSIIYLLRKIKNNKLHIFVSSLNKKY